MNNSGNNCFIIVRNIVAAIKIKHIPPEVLQLLANTTTATEAIH